MASARQKRVIIIETRQRTVVRQNSNQTKTLWCEFCQAEVEMVSPELAASSLGISVREVYRRIELGSLHFFEKETDEVFICFNLFI